MNKNLPHSKEAERALLGALLIDPRQRNEIGIVLRPGDFYDQRHRAIYYGMLTFDGVPDCASLTAHLDTQGELGKAGGAAYLLGLVEELPNHALAGQYAGQVRELAQRRRILEAAAGIAAATKDGAGLALDKAKALLAKLEAEQTAGQPEPKLELLTADEILTTDWPEPTWAVPGLLPVGLTILGGKAKVGKSWLCLQICQAVAAGGMVLGQHVDKGPVLYLALEDPPQRLQERMNKQHWPAGLEADFMPLGRFQDQVGDLRNGGGERLAAQIERRGYRLVVIDTLSRSVAGDQNDAAAMTRALSPVQEIAHAHNCAVLMPDHHHKLAGADALADILGSTAKGAVADTAWGLYRERGKAGAKLAIVGRTVPEKEIDLRFDGVTGCWQAETEGGGPVLTERRQEVLGALQDLGRCKNADVATAIDQDRSNTYKRLQDLVNAGLVNRESQDTQVWYSLTDLGYELLQ